MASYALTSLLESKDLFLNSSLRHEPYGICDVLYFLDSRVRFSLIILKYLSKRFHSHQGLQLAEDKLRILACEAEYCLEECKQQKPNRLAMKILLSKADDIDSSNSFLLKSFGPKFLNPGDQLSYFVNASDSNLYEVHPKIVCSYIDDRSSYHKMFTERLCMLPRTSSLIRVEKEEIVEFLIANSKSELGLGCIIISGSKNGMEKRNLARCIYTDSRMNDWFPIRAWFTVAYGDGVPDLLRGLLYSFMEYLPCSENYQQRLNEMSSEQLLECLYKHLEDQRYFIVIDNLDNSLALGEISYPDKRNGSRILFTANIEITSGITSKTSLVLSGYGWDLILKMFRNLVSSKTSFPEELEIMVPDIINSCEGSLVAVFMVAKFLSTINQTTHDWLIVQQTIQDYAAVFIGDSNSRILSALLEVSEYIHPIHAEETGISFEKCEIKNKQPERFEHLNPSSEVAEAKDNEQVGLEEYLEQLFPELLWSSPQLEKLAIAGMAGIGKTTLAKRIFDDPSISSHFDIQAWIVISQFFQKRSLLIQLLQGITQITDNEILNKTDFQLEETVYRCLKGQRYLIIMDDMWSINAWSQLKRTFPDDKLGSRILLTSRESNFIEGMNCKIVHRMSPLSEKKSWDLLQKKVFGQVNCPQGFAVVGKQIAERCNGLPLAIVVVAGVLLKIDETVESWKVIAESVSSHVMGPENATRTIFALSYEHLPDCLKSCFLYIGAFPGGYEIEVRRLIRLWTSEGFITNTHPKLSEDVAEEYLNDLIDRSLLLSGRRRSNGRLKTCRLHDLVLEFCVQEARKEKFLDVIKDFRLLDSKTTIAGHHHRFSFHCRTFDDVHLTASKSLAGSALFFSVSSHLVPDILIHYFDFKLLRVLDLISWHFDNFPSEQIAKLLLLRYLALTATFELPGILFKLQKLETLIVNGPWLDSYKIPQLPPEFWRSTSLRHLQLRMVNHLLYPEEPADAKDLNFLQTLTNISLASCTYECFSSIPNIMKLCVCETHEEDIPVVGLWDTFFQNVVLLKCIQTLKISCVGHIRPLPLPSLDPFPNSLKKLTLRQSYLPWEAMTLIGDLPNLEVLKLRNNAFRGPLWETREGGFQYLKYLLLEETDLMCWELESHHFPSLEQLVLKFCEALEEIPTEIGDINTLMHIRLENCCSSVERSAKDIQEQCNEYGQTVNIQIRSGQRRDAVKCIT